MAFIDRSGQLFGRLVVVERAERKGRNARWLCRCECGKTLIVYGNNLHSGRTRSCGCLHREKTAQRFSKLLTSHGYARRGLRHPLYEVWNGLRQRCKNPRHAAFIRYGGRGITVCARWDDFSMFLDDVGERPAPGYHLHRIDNDRGYEPGNTEWLSPSEHRRRHLREPITA
jgi:hypothetical protein